LQHCDDVSAEDALMRIDAAMQTFVAGQPQSDDITLIVMRRMP